MLEFLVILNAGTLVRINDKIIKMSYSKMWWFNSF